MWRGVLRTRVVFLMVIAGLLLAACDSTVSSEEPSSGPDQPASQDVETTDPTQACSLPEGVDFEDLDSVELEELSSDDGTTVFGAVYPHPEYEGNPWSQWGQGIATTDGQFFSAIGDHLGPGGNSYIYEYDDQTRQLILISDILSHTDQEDGHAGYGKVHSQMVPGTCGEFYFSTYWGSARTVDYQGTYTGDILFWVDPTTRTLAQMEVPVEQHGTPSLAIDPTGRYLFGEAVDPTFKADGVDYGPFYTYDLVSRDVTYRGPDEPHVGFRSIMVDANGIAYYSKGDAVLVGYDPETDETIERTGLPGDRLRAASSIGPDGLVYGVTQNPDRFFSMDENGDFKELSNALGYTTSLGLDPDGSRFFYMPGAHGNSSEWGSPLIAVDTQTGDQETIVELNDMVESSLGYTVGGTYNVAVSSDGSKVFMGVNVGKVGSDNTFGEVILLVIELP